MSSNFVVFKVFDNIMLPSGKVIASGEFVNRLCRCGFDGKFSSQVIRSMNNNAKWVLSLTSSQVAKVSR